MVCTILDEANTIAYFLTGDILIDKALGMVYIVGTAESRICY